MDNTGLLVEDGDMMFRSLMTTAALVCTCLWGVPGTAAAQTSKSTNDNKCPTVLQHTVERLQDEKPQNLCQYAGQVVLVVNTASFCGFTPQYKSLEELYARYKDKGLVVLGFPSNDFAQEPGNNQKIADFCENTYGVKFPMFTKTTVRGNDALPLFKQLTQLTDTSPKWNFYKYLISRDGKQVKSYNSTTDPLDPKFLAEVDRLLSAKTP
jgi:glutathione peroxidase